MGKDSTWRVDSLHLTLRNAALHSRIFFKQAATLQEAGYRVCVAGLGEPRGATRVLGIVRVQFGAAQSLLCRYRLALRLVVRFRPRVVHLHAPELLFPLGLFARLLGVRVVYDLHEDYRKNRRYGPEYHGLGERTLGDILRGLERLSALWVHRFVYAEAVYATDIRLPRSRVIQNRALFPPPSPPPSVGATTPLTTGVPAMLYTGTLAKTWGILETLAIWAEVNQRRPLELWVYGHAPNPELLVQIRRFVAENRLQSRFRLIGGDTYLDPRLIWAAQATCTLGIAPYRPLPHIRHKVPTRFCEFVVAGKPLLYTRCLHWMDLFRDVYPPFLAIDPEDTLASAEAVLSVLENEQPISVSPQVRQRFDWKTEASVLLDLYRELLGPLPKDLPDLR